jgi:circadian clock protein KaiB
MHPDNNSVPIQQAKSENGALDETLHKFEELVADLAKPHYLFHLYIAGNSPRSTLAIANVRRICKKYLDGHFDLEVIDIYQQPAATKAAQVVAVPTLIKELPFPPKRFIGDMSNTERIVVGLDLEYRDGID